MIEGEDNGKPGAQKNGKGKVQDFPVSARSAWANQKRASDEERNETVSQLT